MKMQGVLPPWLEKLNFMKVLTISGIVFVIGLIFGVVTPPMFKNFVKSKLNLLPDNEVREMYVKTPFFVNFKVYMFNLTNPDEVTNGGKPKLQEIGPYFFEEWKEKFDLIDDYEEDTLSYHYKNTFKFRPDLSGPGLTGNEIITMPHPLIATMLLTVNVDKKPMLGMLKSAIEILFNEPQHMFYTGRVMDILFDGIPIDCTSEKFHAKAVCGAFEGGEIKAVRRINETHYAFSLLAQGNATDLGELKVFRGYKNSEDLGRVVSFNDEPEMDEWNGNECNEYRGTDSTIFPPFMDKNDGIWAYEPSVCRALGAHYVGKSKYLDVETDEFAIDIGSEENSKRCYCRNDECPKKGTFDLFPCVGAPMIASQPHFYLADPSLIANIESGINPVKEKHAIYMHFEMVTGTPLNAAKRLQFNLEIVPIETVPYMAHLREMYYPMFWMEESIELNKSFVEQLKNTVLLAIDIQKTLMWTGLICGFAGIMLAGILMLIAEQSSGQKTTPTSSGTKVDA